MNRATRPAGDARNIEANPPTMALVADFVLEREPASIPPGARERAAALLSNTLGICIAASTMEAGIIARNTAALIHGGNERRHSARMLFDGRRS